MTPSQDFLKKYAQLIKSSALKVLILPSPNRIDKNGNEYRDYDTYEYYLKWMKRASEGKNQDSLAEYHRHQEQGFPLFEEARKRNGV